MGANFPTDTWGSSLTPQRFPFVVIKAGCLRALESIQFAEAMPAPPPPAPGAVPLVHARAICLAGVVHPAAARGSAGSGSGLAGTPDSGFGFGWGSGVGPSSGTVSGPGAGPGYSAGSGGRLRTLFTNTYSTTFLLTQFTLFTNTYSTTYVFLYLASLSTCCANSERHAGQLCSLHTSHYFAPHAQEIQPVAPCSVLHHPHLPPLSDVTCLLGLRFPQNGVVLAF
jgi:hypothetical protein